MIDRAGRDVARPQTRSGGFKSKSDSSVRVPQFTSPRLKSGSAQRPPQSQAAYARVLSGVDRAIITAGVFAAVASASFATYMVSTNHSHPTFNGIEHLMLFAQPNSGVHRSVVAGAPAISPDQGIDFTATGTIPDNSNAPVDGAAALMQREGPIIKGFTLRGVTGNVAMVEGSGGMYRLEPGTTLPGAGRVLAIQWRKGRFVVVTTQGLIGEGQP
ncbi:MAG: hypothetical protein ACYC5H_00125 [Methylovirgula sp.]